MSQTETIQSVVDLPLADVHQRLGATMIVREGYSVPASYGDLEDEYRAVRESNAGVIDLSPRGRLIISGSEAVQFLNGLITNDMKTLAEGTWMAAAFPNVQGRLVASVRVARLPGEQFLIDTEPATRGRVFQALERFTFAGDFRVNDLVSKTAHITVQGKKARVVVQQLIGEAASSLGMSGVITQESAGETPVPQIILRGTHTGEDGYDIITATAQAVALWQRIIEAGARPVGYEALETLRIEAGIARYGVDVDETNVVTEGNFDDAVSYTKGCYIGQEIIARIKYRGHVAKKLTGLKFEAITDVAAGAPVSSTEGKEIGTVTSVAFSPALERTIALALIKYDFLAAGTNVRVGDSEAEVAQLPFVGTAAD